jgi:hypothetical protein
MEREFDEGMQKELLKEKDIKIKLQALKLPQNQFNFRL